MKPERKGKRKEKWKWIPGYKEYYKASTKGRIKSVERLIYIRSKRGNYWKVIPGKMLAQVPMGNKSPYLVVALCKEGIHRNKLVHQIVLETFRGKCPRGKEACHYPDRNPRNNAIENLRWDTPKANAADRDYHGKTAKGWKLSASKMANERRQAIIDLYQKCRYSIPLLSRIFAKPETTIQYLISTYKYRVMRMIQEKSGVLDQALDGKSSGSSLKLMDQLEKELLRDAKKKGRKHARKTI